MAQPANGRCRLMLSVSWRTFMSQRSSEKTTMAKPKKTEKLQTQRSGTNREKSRFS